mgnify:CR=1 FL=1
MNSHPNNAAPLSLDLTQDVADLTAQLMDIESVSGNERAIADAVEASLRALPHLEVVRDGDTVMARTQLNRGERVAERIGLSRVRVQRAVLAVLFDRHEVIGIDQVAVHHHDRSTLPFIKVVIPKVVPVKIIAGEWVFFFQYFCQIQSNSPL